MKKEAEQHVDKTGASGRLIDRQVSEAIHIPTLQHLWLVRKHLHPLRGCSPRWIRYVSNYTSRAVTGLLTCKEPAHIAFFRTLLDSFSV